MKLRTLILAIIVLCLPATVMAAPAKAREKAKVAATGADQKSLPRQLAHRVVIQIDDSDPKLINLALNNAENMREHYIAHGQKIEIEIVTFGPGLHMLRADTSPVKDRIAQMSLAMPELKFLACGNTQAKMAAAEHKSIPLVSEAHVVPSGVVSILEFQEQGYSYIRP
jgi:uncharacterized protein